MMLSPTTSRILKSPGNGNSSSRATHSHSRQKMRSFSSAWISSEVYQLEGSVCSSPPIGAVNSTFIVWHAPRFRRRTETAAPLLSEHPADTTRSREGNRAPAHNGVRCAQHARSHREPMHLQCDPRTECPQAPVPAVARSTPDTAHPEPSARPQ